MHPINKIPTNPQPDYGIPREGEDCRICFSPFLSSETPFVSKTECQHIYHTACILEWLNIKKTCPLCVRKLDTVSTIPLINNSETEVPLVAACRYGNVDFIRSHYAKSPDDITRCYCSNTHSEEVPLIVIATESKQLEVVRLLLDYHPNAIIPRCKIETDALAIALDKGHLEIADLLLSRDINVVPSDLYRAARQTNSSETFIRILEKLRENRSPDDFHRIINGSVTKDISPLRDCASRGTADNVKALLKYGADVDAKGSNGHTALYFAAVNGHLDVVQPLLKHGADTNVTVHNGLSMLLATIQHGYYRVATVLAKHPGTDIHLAYEEETPIMACFEAYRSGTSVDMELVKTLIQAGAHIDRGSISPFAHAIMHYTSEVVSVLIEGQNRGKINQPVFTGEQSIELFCNDQNQLRSEFVEYYSHFTSEDSSGMRPLTLAIFCKKPKTAQLLIDAGATATRNDQELAAIKEIRELIIFPPSQQLLCTSGASHSQEAQATEINNPLATAIIAGTSAEDIISRYRVNKKGKKPLVDEAVVDLTESIKLLETKFSATSERHDYCTSLKRSDGKGMRPITLAVLYQNQAAFESLIKAGAFIRINDHRLARLVNNKAMQQTIYQKLTKEHQQRLDEKHRQ